MAPAITHFLTGAGLALLLAAPIALRCEIDRSWGLWLVPLGGVWGLLPDIHNIAPVYRAQLYAAHHSAGMDLFALHHLLDRPTIRELYLESIFASILLFICSAGLFSGVQVLHDRNAGRLSIDRSQWPVAVIALIATGYAGGLCSVLVLDLGRYELLAALIGRDGLVAGWLVLAACSSIAAVGLTGLFEWGLPAPYRSTPRDGLLTGAAVSAGSWVLASFLVPLWLRYLSGALVAVPVFDWESLLIIGAFVSGFIFVYTLVRGFFD